MAWAFDADDCSEETLELESKRLVNVTNAPGHFGSAWPAKAGIMNFDCSSHNDNMEPGLALSVLACCPRLVNHFPAAVQYLWDATWQNMPVTSALLAHACALHQQ